VRANLKSVHLDMKRFGLNVVAIERDAIPENVSDWVELRKRFPESRVVFAVSRVAFNADGTVALVYWQYRCGGECGTGSLTQMNLVDGNWVIVKTLELWFS